MAKKLTLVILLIGFFSFAKSVNAQCSGTVACGNNVVRQCRNSSGSNCIEGTPDCNCTSQCIGGGTHSCNAYPFCQGSSICGVYEGVCVRSGSCNYTPPPPPDDDEPDPPPNNPGWGSCGSCSGCPGGNSSQCRTDPSGGCVWDPGGCGGGGGGSRSCQFYARSTRFQGDGGGPGYPIALQANNTYRRVGVALGGSNGLPDRVCFRSVDPDITDGFDARFQISSSSDGDRSRDGDTPFGQGYYETSIRSSVPMESRLWAYDDDDNDCSDGPERCEIMIPVYFADPSNPGPTMTITSPIDGQTFAGGNGTTLPITATITDDQPTIYASRMTRLRVGDPERSRLFVGGVLNAEPFTWIWADPPSSGADWRFRGYVVDNHFNVAWSNTVRVTPTTNQAPTVTIDSPPNGKPVIVGAPEPILATATDSDGDTISQVEFQVSINGAAYTPLSTDTAGPPWSSELTCTEPSPHTIRARATDSNGNTGPWSTPVTVNGLEPNPWFQVIGGSIMSRGNISSPIPPTLSEYFLVDDVISNKPGLAIYSGSVSVGNGTLSRTEWQTNTSTTINPFNYAHFDNLASGKIPPQNEFVSGLPANLQSSGIVATDGYYYVRHNGNLTITSPLTIDNAKIVIFVNGNLTINQRININNRRNSFLMFVVNGNINVSPSVSSSGQNDPAIEGMFFANGTFTSGTNNTDDNMLVVRGSVAASNISLNRDLQIENSTSPAETFIFSPELVVNYPPAMSVKHLVWREVAP